MSLRVVAATGVTSSGTLAEMARSERDNDVTCPVLSRVPSWRAVSLTALVLVGCSTAADDAGTGCEGWVEVLASIDELSHGEELPSPAELRILIDTIVDRAEAIGGIVDGSESEAIRQVEISAREYRRSVEPYGFDLLAARTAGSTEEQERLYVFDHAETVDAIDRFDNGAFVAACEPSDS